jgi:acetyl esterase/lipase
VTRKITKLQALSGPALLIVGSADGPAPPENAAAFSRAADAAHAAAEVYVYPGAAHAFAQPLFNQGQTYDPGATHVACGSPTIFSGDACTSEARRGAAPFTRDRRKLWGSVLMWPRSFPSLAPSIQHLLIYRAGRVNGRSWVMPRA